MKWQVYSVTTYPIFSKNKALLPTKTTAFGWPDFIVAVVVIGLALLVYGRTLTPGLLAGDGGEFQTLTYLWGHSHPTGYPVYLTLARLFALLPTGGLAYRVNLFSAVMAALAVAGVYVNGRLLSRYRLIPLAGALIFTLSPTFWSQAIIAEVYTAGAAFFVWIVAALLWWHATGSRRALFAAGLLGGLSLGVHMSVALLAPVMGLFLLLPSRESREWRLETRPLISTLQSPLLGAATGLALTILLFLLMDWNNPTASYFTSVIEPSRSAWGLAANRIDGSFERLFWGWRAQQFQSFMWQTAVFPQQSADYWQNLPNELPVPLLLSAVVGLVALLIQCWQTAVFLLLALAIQLLYFFQYDIWDLYVFYIPSYLLLALLAIAGLGTVADGAIARLPEKSPKIGIEIVMLLLFLWAVWPTVLPQITAVSAGETPFDFDENPTYSENVELIATAVSAQLPANAILFTDWEMLYPYYYAAHVLQGRDDLMFIETFPADDQERVAASLIEFVAAQANTRPLYFSERLAELTEAGLFLSPARLGPLRAYKVQNE